MTSQEYMRLCRTVVALCVACSAFAQENSEPTIRQQVNVVYAPVTVLDQEGNFVPGVRPNEFRLFDNGRQQAIQVTETFLPVSLVVAVQANARVDPVLPTIRKTAGVLQSMVAGDRGEVAVISFDHRIQVLQDFTTDGDRIGLALDKIKAGSSSSRLIDATIEATRMLRNRPRDRRRVLLLISETRDIASEGKVREALTNLEMHNVLVYSVNISRLRTTEGTGQTPPPRPDPIPPGARPRVNPTAPDTPSANISQGSANFIPLIGEIFRAAKGTVVDNPIEVFTKYSGGKERSFITQRQLEEALAEVGREIHNQYIITYNPNNKDEGGFHAIRVEVTRPGLEIRTRDGYWLAASR